jgi:hypothetical protein
VRLWWPGGSRARLLSNATGVSEQGSSLPLSTRRAAEKGRACSNPSAVVLSTGKCAAAPVGYLETGASMGRVPNGYRDRDAETVLYLAADVSSCTVLPEIFFCFLRSDLCRRGGDAIEPIESGARNQLLCTACRSESLRPIIKVSKDKEKQWRASSPW